MQFSFIPKLVLLLSLLFKYASCLHLDGSKYSHLNLDQNNNSTKPHIDSIGPKDLDISEMGYKAYSRQEEDSPPSDSATEKEAFLNKNEIQFMVGYRNKAYLDQIMSSEVHCELGIVINQSVLEYFKDPKTLIEFLNQSIENLNKLFTSNFLVGGKPVVLFKIKTIYFDDGFEPYTKFISDPGTLLKAFNQYTQSSSRVHHCITMLITASNWGSTLGMAFNRSKGGDTLSQLNSCNYPNSSFVTTVIVDGAPLNSEKMSLLMAHEIGHVFGLEHTESEASPGMPAYQNTDDELMSQMHAITTQDLVDTLKLSSLKNMKDPNNDNFYLMNTDLMMIPKNIEGIKLAKDLPGALGKIITSGEGCFRSYVEGICGDGIVKGEEEECDTTKDKKCCTQPMDLHQCKLVEDAKCTKADGPCCQENCQFKDDTSKCYDNPSDCQSSKSTCDGSSAKCPVDQDLEGSSCRFDTGKCHQGECTDSICEDLGGQKCDNKKYECFESCTFDGKRCDPYIKGIYMIPKRDGTLCSFNRGYCIDGFCSRKIQDIIMSIRLKSRILGASKDDSKTIGPSIQSLSGLTGMKKSSLESKNPDIGEISDFHPDISMNFMGEDN